MGRRPDLVFLGTYVRLRSEGRKPALLYRLPEHDEVGIAMEEDGVVESTRCELELHILYHRFRLMSILFLLLLVITHV